MDETLVVGGYGEVGRRLAEILQRWDLGSVAVAGRNPERASGFPARKIDVDDDASIDRALNGVGLVVACVRQRDARLLKASVRRGIAYTSIAPPPTSAQTLEALHADAQRTGARIILGAGIEPGISSVLARVGADRVGTVDAVETALLLSLGDRFGADSLAFILGELGETYSVFLDGSPTPARAFDRWARVQFPSPIGTRRGYTMPFSDQAYYPATLGARRAIAWLALDPSWLGPLVSMLARLGVGRWLGAGRAGAVGGAIKRLRRAYSGRDRFALIVEVRGRDRIVRSTLVGRGQAEATAVGAAAIAEALRTGEVGRPGVWLAEQVVAPEAFLERLAEAGFVPVTIDSATAFPR